MIQKTLQNRATIKMNEMMVGESGSIYINKQGEQGMSFPLYEVKGRLLNGEFDNMVNVVVEGPNGQSGPNVKPSQKGIKRLLSIIKNTSYRVVQQNGQHFTLEGEN